METTYFEALFSVKNRKTTLILMAFTTMQQLTACNVFCMYSNRIITVVNAHMPDNRKVLAN